MVAQQSSTIVAHKLERLAEMYRQCQVSEVMRKTIDKLFEYEAETCRIQISNLEKDLKIFEKQYHQTSDGFYQLFNDGKTDDRMDFIEWASLVQMVLRLKNRLALLTIEEPHDDGN